MLLPATGTWRLFLQVVHGGKLHHRAVHAEGAMRRREHLAGFGLGLVLVILGGRALAYAATPTPLAAQLGGPRLPVITFVALALASRALARRALARGARRARAPRARSALRARRPASRSRASPRTPSLLGGGSLLGFAALETWMHSRAGMHMHWWMCLEGPVHRNAIPILLALVAGGRGAARRPAPRARVGAPRRRTSCGVCCSRAPHDGRSRSLLGQPTAPAVAARSRPARSRAARALHPVATRHERENVMNRIPMRRASAYAGVLVATLALAPSAFAHAELFPNEIPSGDGYLLKLAVPNEKENASTTQIQITMPADFDLEHVADVPGWTSTVAGQKMVDGEMQGGNSITWKGKLERRPRSPCCRSPACPRTHRHYAFTVRQTYSDGSVVAVVGRRELGHARRAHHGDAPRRASSGGSSDSSKTIAIVALVVGGLGLLVGGAGLVAGRRSA